MKKLSKLVIAILCIQFLFLPGNSFAQLTPEKLGWKMGVQTYSFRNVSFFEAVDKTKSLGLKYLEAYPGQTIGGGIEGKMDYKMDAAKRKQILNLLKKKKMKMVAYGVVVPQTDEDWRTLFEFAKAMKLENIVSEPKSNQLDLISKLCDEFKINVAIHNHPNPSHYWTPDSVLTALQGRSLRMGACADIGHWAFSGLDVVECLKKLEGRIIEFHFKDVANKQPEKNEITTVSGKGIVNVQATIEEMQRQNFKGVVSTEYEADPQNNIGAIRESLEYFKEVVSKLK